MHEIKFVYYHTEEYFKLEKEYKYRKQIREVMQFEGYRLGRRKIIS